MHIPAYKSRRVERHFSDKCQKNAAGFTIIELTVAVGIVAVLSAIVIASIGTAREKARDNARQADMKQLQLALETYKRLNNGQYPTDAVCLIGQSGCLDELVSAGVLQRLPTDPRDTATQRYQYAGDANICTDPSTNAAGSEFTLWVAAEGEQPGQSEDTWLTTGVIGVSTCADPGNLPGPPA